jgi:hypothetical protein
VRYPLDDRERPHGEVRLVRREAQLQVLHGNYRR